MTFFAVQKRTIIFRQI